MAPWTAPWRRANNLGTLSDNSDADVNSDTGRNGNSQGEERAKSDPSPDDITSSTSTTHSVFSLTSNYVQSSPSILSPSPTSNSSTGPNFLSSLSVVLVSSPFSSHLQSANKPVSLTPSPETTTSIVTRFLHSSKPPMGHQANYSLDCSSSSSSSLSATQRTDPSADLAYMDTALSSPPESVAQSLTFSSKIPSSTLSSKKITPFITSVTPSVLSTTLVASPSVLKTTGSVFIAHDPPSGTRSSPVPSDTPQRHGKSKLEPSQGSSVSLPLDTPTSSLVEVGRIPISTTSSPSPPTATSITPTAIAVFPLPSFSGADGTPPSNNQFAAFDRVSSTADFSNSTAFSRDVISSFATTTAIVTFSPIQISGSPTSIPVTATVQTVLPTVLPVSPVPGKKSVPVAAIVAPVSAAVILIFLLVGLVFRQGRQRARRASLPAFDLSSPAPAPPATRKTEQVQEQPLFKEETVLPPIPARAALVAHDADPFADPGATLEKMMPPSSMPLPDVVPSLVLPPVPTLDPFADPPAAVLTSHASDGDGLSRLSAGSAYDEFIARASMSSSHVGYAM